MKNLKVAFIHNTIAPYRHPLFEALSEFVDLTVYYCSVKHGKRKWDLWPRSYDYKYKILPRIPIGDRSINPSIIKEIILNKFDVLILGGYIDPTNQIVFALGLILKIPIIYSTEGIKEPRSIFGIITKPIRYLFAKKSDACIAQGNITKKYLRSLGAANAKIFIAHNCIDNELFIRLYQQFEKDKNHIRKRLGFNEKYLLLYIGQLIPRKGVFDLIKIYEKVIQKRKDTGLIILGSGPLKSQLLDIISKKGIPGVHFIEGGISFSELIKYYSIADIFVLPTLRDLAPLVINEAMACGLPIVVYDSAGNAKQFVFSDNNGYVIKKGDIDTFSKSIIEILDNKQLRKEMSNNSRKIITTIGSVEKAVNGYIEAIKYCIKGMFI